MSVPYDLTKLDTREFLELCSGLYDSLVCQTEDVRKRCSAEAVLEWIEMAAGFASMHHSGRFVDGAIENLALELGTELRPATRRLKASSPRTTGHLRKRRLLHVATFVSALGGHTRLLLNWIKKDRGSHHSLVLTRQRSIPFYPPVKEALDRSGGQLISFPDNASIIERACWLRQFARESADLIILHLVPNDAVPIVAFADGCETPVALVNIADHLFWLGNTVADTVINLRDISIAANAECRSTREDQFLPIPLFETHRKVCRNEARKKLGISQSETVLLTVGRALKYAPSPRQNFFKTARAVLGRNQNSHLYLVGLSPDDHAVSSKPFYHERMHFVGPVDDATIWQRAADVYLEGFPFGSQTALLESVLPGVPCVRVYAPLSPLLTSHDISLTGFVECPASEEAYIDNASGFIRDRGEAGRVGEMLRQRVLRYHVEDTWMDFLTKIYSAAERMKHVAVKVPCKTSSFRQVDLAISEYHGTRYTNKTDIKSALAGEIHKEILRIAYNLRQRGFYKDAFQLVRLANRDKNWDRDSILFAAKLLPHRIIHRRRLLQQEVVRSEMGLS